MSLAHELIEAFPKQETPAHTENREGFYHLLEMEGTCESASLAYIIRDLILKNLQPGSSLFKSNQFFESEVWRSFPVGNAGSVLQYGTIYAWRHAFGDKGQRSFGSLWS